MSHIPRAPGIPQTAVERADPDVGDSIQVRRHVNKRSLWSCMAHVSMRAVTTVGTGHCPVAGLFRPTRGTPVRPSPRPPRASRPPTQRTIRHLELRHTSIVNAVMCSIVGVSCRERAQDRTADRTAASREPNIYGRPCARPRRRVLRGDSGCCATRHHSPSAQHVSASERQKLTKPMPSGQFST